MRTARKVAPVPPRNMAVRIGLAIGVAVVGVGSVAHSLALAVQRGNPAWAYGIMPFDGRITAQHARQTLNASPNAAGAEAAARLGRRALIQDPTAVMGIPAIGASLELAGDLKRSRRLLAYAERLTRRDLQAHLWAIEAAVKRDDIPGALRHYDFALRTNRSASELLFPVLASAIDDDAIRAQLALTLAKRPTWGPLFLEYAAGNGPHGRATASLFRQLGQAGTPISGISKSLLINTLASRGEFGQAWSYFRVIRPGVSPLMSRDPGFTGATDATTIFDWSPVNADGISASIQRTDNGAEFGYAAPSGVGGPVLQQIQMLPPGRYVLEGRSAGIEQTGDALPYWTLVCQSGVELGRVIVPQSSEAGGAFSGRFTVPRDCPVQTLQLVARPSDTVSGSSGQIVRALLSPERGTATPK